MHTHTHTNTVTLPHSATHPHPHPHTVTYPHPHSHPSLFSNSAQPFTYLHITLKKTRTEQSPTHSTHLSTKVPGAKVDRTLAAAVEDELVDVDADGGQGLSASADLLVGNPVAPVLHTKPDLTKAVTQNT